MKAVVVKEFGNVDGLVIENRPIPKCAEDEVLIHVFAAGVNRPDIIQRKGKYPAPKNAPQDILGLEVAGKIVALGVNVKNFKIGDNVCALIAGGGYAEFAVANKYACLPVPSNFSFIQAAALPETIFTVWYNVFIKGDLKKGETILIHGGTSGIGVTAIQLAKYFGARVFVTTGTNEKCKACIEIGADKAINYNIDNFEDVLKDEGVDLVLDMIGGNYTSKNLNLLKEDGRLVLINAMQSAKAEINLLQVMSKRLTITGSTLRARSNEFKGQLAKDILQNVWPVILNGGYMPVIASVFDMSEAKKAHLLMESSQHIGKIILTNKM